MVNTTQKIASLRRLHKRINKEIYNNQLRDAFILLHELVKLTQDWELSQMLNNIETSYRYLLQYYTDGVPDPERSNLYRSIKASTYELSDSALFSLMLQLPNNLFFTKQRSSDYNLPELIHKWKKLYAEMVGINNDISAVEKQQEFTQKQDQLLSAIFENVLLSMHKSGKNSDIDELKQLLNDNSLDVDLKTLVISAMLLNLMYRFDEQKLLLLFDAYSSENEEIRQRALIVIMVILYLFDKRITLYPNILNRIAILSENPGFKKNICFTILQFIRSKETEEITRKINDEILPEMIKVSSLIHDKLKADDLNDQLSWEEKNPEWQELFEESKIRDKLAEFTNMQMEGSDVFMSTFANLKSFPFFQHLAHWFLPFNKKYLLPTDDNLADIKMLEFLNLLMITPYLCNSDKYSFCYSVIQLPNQFRIISTTQFKIESAEIQKLENEENLLHGPKVAQYVVKQYIQDLYRFFKLHPERNQFIDIFSLPLSFHKTSSLSQIISDTESLRKFGELYFSKNFFSHAETIFTQLTQRDSTDNEIYEKIGYCRQMASDFEGALAAYLQSDIIRPDKPWTMQRIAMCYRRLKQPEKALEYYRMLERLTPENLSLQLNIGHCYFEQHAYAEALNCYYRVEFADEKQTRTMRPIAWTSFLMGKVDIAKRYYNAILDDKPTVQDYMNAGHVEWLLGNRRETIRLYKLAISLSDGNEIIFTTDFEKDIPDLIAAGIDKSEINLLIDELFYEFYE